MAATLHQFRCFLAALEHGSFTRAADELGLSQPSLSEQVRLLERGLRVPLFHRLGRGVAATEAATALRPHALAALAAADAGGQAVAEVSRAEAGTARFGLFGAAHLYIAADLVSAVLADHPGLCVALVGQNSTDVITDIRRGRLEAGLVVLPVDDDEQLSIRPVARDEVVYLSADPGRARHPVTPARLAAAPLVLSEVTWGERDHTRQQLTRSVQAARRKLRPRIEVENVETALEVAAHGHADTIAARGVVRRLADQLPHPLFEAPLRPRIHDDFAIVHRHNTVLSRAGRTLVDHATALLLRATRATDGG